MRKFWYWQRRRGYFACGLMLEPVFAVSLVRSSHYYHLPDGTVLTFYVPVLTLEVQVSIGVD